MTRSHLSPRTAAPTTATGASTWHGTCGVLVVLLAGIGFGGVNCSQDPPRAESEVPGLVLAGATGATGAAAVCPRSCTRDNPEGDCDDDGVHNGVDCAPCDSTLYRRIAADQDGDGTLNNELVGEWICAGSEIPTGYVADNRWDCDDVNHAAFQKVCQDADQDGRCAPNSEMCVGTDIPPGYRLIAALDRVDCDDNDPTRQQSVFYDEDGDGDDADWSHPPACVGATDAGASSLNTWGGGDCDDHDPTFSCSTVDLLFDGRDTNCDGDDGSAQCSQLSGASALCQCWPRDTCRVATTCSERADLNIVDVEPSHEACSACSHPYGRDPDGSLGISNGGDNARVLLVNSGGAVFDGAVIVGDKNDRYPSLKTALVLAPGESRIFDICRLAGSVKLEITSGDDCVSDNNSAEIPLALPMCGD